MVGPRRWSYGNAETRQGLEHCALRRGQNRGEFTHLDYTQIAELLSQTSRRRLILLPNHLGGSVAR